MNTPHQQTQGHETAVTRRQGSTVCPHHRSLKTGPGRLRVGFFGFAPFRLLMVLVLIALVVPTQAQEVEDTIKIKTRVVFLDALVKDKKTNFPSRI